MAHLEPESTYQRRFCPGVVEYVLPDKTRIDCLTEGYAIEIDFAEHWNQSPGQAVFYARYYNLVLGVDRWKEWVKPGIGLIIESADDCRFLKRLRIGTDLDIFQIGPYANKC